MNFRDFVFIVVVSFLATLLRFLINHNFVISIFGSFLFGFIIAKRLNKSLNEIFLTGFCSCFTSFTGFIYLLYKLILENEFIKFFLYLNVIIILNILMMYFGFMLSRKMI